MWRGRGGNKCETVHPVTAAIPYPETPCLRSCWGQEEEQKCGSLSAVGPYGHAGLTAARSLRSPWAWVVGGEVQAFHFVYVFGDVCLCACCLETRFLVAALRDGWDAWAP